VGSELMTAQDLIQPRLTPRVSRAGTEIAKRLEPRGMMNRHAPLLPICREKASTPAFLADLKQLNSFISLLSNLFIPGKPGYY
jgi:hypothetical protein